jgi:hypothetical protein
MAVVLSPVYTAVTWQWVYVSQYFQFTAHLKDRFSNFVKLNNNNHDQKLLMNKCIYVYCFPLLLCRPRYFDPKMSATSVQTAGNILTIHQSASTSCSAVYESMDHWWWHIPNEKCVKVAICDWIENLVLSFFSAALEYASAGQVSLSV